jgi:colicin import membrane protein
MWRWLPSVLCNKSSFCISARRLFFLQLMGLVCAVHLAVLLVYAVIAWLAAGKDRFKISLTQSGATYVLMPFEKKSEHRNKDAVKKTSLVNKKSNVIDHATYERKKNSKKQKNQVSAKMSKSSIAAQKAEAKIKNAKTKIQEKSSVSLQKAKKSDGHKSAALKKSKNKKSSTKIEEVIETTVQPIVEELVVQPQIVPVETAVPEVVKSIEPEVIDVVATEVATLDQDDDFDEDNVIFVGYQELDQSIVGSKIQHMIQQSWMPPVGMKPGITCEVLVSLNKDGVVINAKVARGSGVFVYDACARKTLQKIEYPVEVWNKTITIVLGAS